jgi:hypothetical protein
MMAKATTAATRVTARPMAQRATRVSDAAAGALDLLLGPADGMTGFKRCDVSVTRSVDGHVHVEIEIPPAIGRQVGDLLAALGVGAKR